MSTIPTGEPCHVSIGAQQKQLQCERQGKSELLTPTQSLNSETVTSIGDDGYCCVCLTEIDPRSIIELTEEIACLDHVFRMGAPESRFARPLHKEGKLLPKSVRSNCHNSTPDDEPLLLGVDSAESFESVPVRTPCKHVCHLSCLMHWLHCAGSHPCCPLCSAALQIPALKRRRWEVKNLAIPAMPSPDSRKHGLKQTGWYSVQLRPIPPPHCTITQLEATFHPAFSLPKLLMTKGPFEFVVKLCSSSVVVVLELECVNAVGVKQHMRLVHAVAKKSQTSNYYQDLYTGAGETGCSPVPEPDKYFEALLKSYNKDANYYEASPITPSRVMPYNPPRYLQGSMEMTPDEPPSITLLTESDT